MEEISKYKDFFLWKHCFLKSRSVVNDLLERWHSILLDFYRIVFFCSSIEFYKIYECMLFFCQFHSINWWSQALKQEFSTSLSRRYRLDLSVELLEVPPQWMQPVLHKIASESINRSPRVTYAHTHVWQGAEWLPYLLCTPKTRQDVPL